MKACLVLQTHTGHALSILWLNFKIIIQKIPPLSLSVVVCAVRLLTAYIIFRTTLLSLEKTRVEFKFFPAVAIITSVFQRTTIFVIFCVFFVLPDQTLLRLVIKDVRLSSKILPIMSVYTFIPRVLLLTEWAPHCFVVEHEKIIIHVHFFKNVDRKFIFMVRERTHIAILTTVNFIWITLAEFCLVLFRMIEIFNSVVTHVAIVAVLAVPGLYKLGTNFGYVFDRRSSSISYLSFVIVETFF